MLKYFHVAFKVYYYQIYKKKSKFSIILISLLFLLPTKKKILSSRPIFLSHYYFFFSEISHIHTMVCQLKIKIFADTSQNIKRQDKFIVY